MGDMSVTGTKTRTIMSVNKGEVLACGDVASSLKYSVERRMIYEDNMLPTLPSSIS